MKDITRLTVRLLAITFLLAPFATGQATTNEGGGKSYALEGEILEMDRKNINIGDVQLRLSPTVKVKVPGKKNASLSDIRKGNKVGVKMIQYRGNAYVDTIFFISKEANDQ